MYAWRFTLGDMIAFGLAASGVGMIWWNFMTHTTATDIACGILSLLAAFAARVVAQAMGGQG